MSLGVAIAIISIICSLSMAVVGILIRRNFSLTTRAESKRAKLISDDIDSVKDDLYEIKIKVTSISEDMIVVKSRANVHSERLIDLRDDMKEALKKYEKSVGAFHEYAKQTNTRLARIETINLTILKGGE